MNENSLIEVKENIFTKIRNFFKKIFQKENKKTQKKAIVNNEQFKDTKKQSEKEEFFDLYKEVKEGNIDLYSLENSKLQMLYKLLEQECNLKEKRLKDTKDEIEVHKKNIMIYNNVKLQEKI